MGLSFRKSVKAGPFRFNLSGSGIGVSVGVPGFRVGTGPRGNYVSMSAGGFTYRKSLGPLTGREPAIPGPTQEPRGYAGVRPGEQFIPSGSNTVAPLQVIASADIRLLSDTDSASLVDEINGKRNKVPVWYLPLILLLVVWWFVPNDALHNAPVRAGAALIASVVIFVATFWLYMWDEARRCTVLFYDFDEEAERIYEGVITSFTTMKSCRAIWHVLASGHVLDGRYNAGAGHTITRRHALFNKGGVRHVRCNIDVPALNAGKKTFYFYPDRILIADGSHVAVCTYESINFNVQLTSFIEDGAVPSDSKVIGHTWRFVNNNGTPDRRFKNNRQLPIAQYEQLQLSSVQGVKELYHLSKVGAAQAFVHSISGLGRYQTTLRTRAAS
jgi:hypothetical protein